eukprot:NODE_8132_length_383_cov_6.761719_g7966_i0.p1 GENE.NODE_8132_length_383_cov_6.761719_g7966_i0~~NODE_8132_length_383_cov_6.761719_g7966_i0.p1  ORF type:complete len:123 (-),score=24.10 NODE_8132_length_383_cov_6.761719_g7966_i0:13-381(-)
MVETLSTKLGLPPHRITSAQLHLTSCRVVSMLGGMLGVMLGCILGMFPLLFMEDENTRRLKGVFQSLDTQNEGFLSRAAFATALTRSGLVVDQERFRSHFPDTQQQFHFQDLCHCAKALGTC